MNLDRVRPIADAVLYEGYILYPYRAGSAKNRQRWTFGGIFPRSYFDATSGADPWRMRTECLVEGDRNTKIVARVRFLQPLAREVGEIDPPLPHWTATGEPAFRPVASLRVGEREIHSWQEAVERDVAMADAALGELNDGGREVAFEFGASRELEPVRNDAGSVCGVILRHGCELRGRVHLDAVEVAPQVHRISVCIENHTEMEQAVVTTRERASLYSFASTHTILGVEAGAFVSLTDPPRPLAAAAATCVNDGAWPVLVGDPDVRDLMLCSPIILYDYPEVAPESPGDLFDATEIDEILSLNILAMTDAEKREMAATDPRAAALLARTESLNGADFIRLHGTLRVPRPNPPAAQNVDVLTTTGVRLRVGGRVRLRPRRGGDVLDLVLAGKTAVIESIERDFEDRVHVAVTVDDDPGREWGLQRMPGHRFFFSAEEIEPLQEARA